MIKRRQQKWQLLLQVLIYEGEFDIIVPILNAGGLLDVCRLLRYPQGDVISPSNLRKTSRNEAYRCLKRTLLDL